jgi:hypothetical protein
VLAGVGEHVVPLEELGEDDAVDEAAQAEAEQEGWELGRAGGDGRPLPRVT